MGIEESMIEWQGRVWWGWNVLESERTIAIERDEKDGEE